MNIIDTHLTYTQPFTKRSKPTLYIVLHHAEASQCTVDDIHAWHLANGWSGFGYHFFVHKDGTVYSGRPIDALGAHCSGFNDVSIGICAEGAYMTESMPDVQRDAIVALNKYIINLYPNIQIKKHKELVITTQCPGDNYPFDYIKSASVHWAMNAYNTLTNHGIIIKEKRFDDQITRGEVFVLLAQIVNKFGGVK